MVTKTYQASVDEVFFDITTSWVISGSIIYASYLKQCFKSILLIISSSINSQLFMKTNLNDNINSNN